MKPIASFVAALAVLVSTSDCCFADAPADAKPPSPNSSPATKPESTPAGLESPVQILEKEMLAWLGQTVGLGELVDKMVQNDQFAPAAVYGGVNLAVTTIGLELKALFLQEGLLTLLASDTADKKAVNAAIFLLGSSYTEMCKQIDTACDSLEAGVFNLKKLNLNDDANRIEATFIKRLRFIKAEFFVKRRDQLKAMIESAK